MSPPPHRTTPHDERELAARHSHSALEEFGRDERRPAVLLLGALVIAAVFFALGIMLGRWMAEDTNKAFAPRPAHTVNQPFATPSAPSPRP